MRKENILWIVKRKENILWIVRKMENIPWKTDLKIDLSQMFAKILSLMTERTPSKQP